VSTLRRSARRRPTLTTPGEFRLVALALVAGLVALALVSVGVALGRGDATDAVVDDATPLLVGAEELYVALADADAAASTAYLRAGLEPPELRARYLDDLEMAGAQLALIAARTRGSAASSDAVARITQELPVYAGQVESARANNRLDHPVGASYLRRASESMRNSMLPAATGIYEEAARRLYDSYDEGTSTRHRVALLVVGGTVLLLLVAAQVLVALRTRRVLNLGLVGATVIVAALGAWALVALDAQERELSHSQREGSDQLIILSTARILALRSLSDENLHLIERGTDPVYREDFDLVTARVGGTDGSGGLLEDARQLAERTSRTAAVERIRGLWDDYLLVNDQVRRLDDADEYLPAVRIAVNDQADAAARLDAALGAEIDVARVRVDTGAGAASGHVRWLAASLLATIILAAVLVVAGLWVRMKEYR
jgi:hypothetical protein